MGKKSYKEQIQGMDNRALLREHFLLHLDPSGNSIKHMTVVSEMKKRNLRHYEKKGSDLDEKYNQFMDNLKVRQTTDGRNESNE